MNPTDIDLTVLHAINGHAGDWTLDRIAGILVKNQLVKHGLIIASLWILWFRGPGERLARHAAICVILFLAIPLSLIANRLVSIIVPFRPRPMFWTDIGFVQPSFGIAAGLDEFTSFPSDHAALYGAIIAGLWFISRPAALLVGIWAVPCLLARIYFGLHFPTDILAGLAIGGLIAAGLHRGSLLRSAARIVAAIETRAALALNAACALMVFEVGNLFEGVRGLARSAGVVMQAFH